MKAQELRDLSRDELTRRLDELYQELFNLRFQLATKQLNDTSRVRQVRKDIARVKTVLREMEIEAEVQ
ncbi:MAG TPA: 50S ribosomal protein L29 [Chloroflexi bacterium]|jgi:large subunit ribosomal protein L29|nr:50S ribosomal protein L29 [Chloroflexota bacterium]